MDFSNTIFVILINLCLCKTETITILLASDFQEVYDEIKLENGTCVGGVARIKHLADKYQAHFIYLGNGLSSINSTNLKERRDRAFAVFDAFSASAYVFSLNEFSHSKEDFNQFVKHFSQSFPMSNVVIPQGMHNIFISSFGVISYVTEDVKRLPGAADLVVENAVKFLESTATALLKSGHKFIIAAGCCGLNMAIKIAKRSTNIFAVISGCSKQLFWNTNAPPEKMSVNGKFPVVVKNTLGRKVLVVHIYGSSKFLGKLEVEIDGKNIKRHSGEMLYMYNEIPQDPAMLEILERYKNVKIPNQALPAIMRPIGKSAVFLNGECYKSECNLGNLIADAFVLYKSNIYTGENWTDTPIGLVGAGMVKASINATKNKGVIMLEDIEDVIPNDDKLVTMSIKGIDLRRALEESFDFIPKQGSPKYLQVSGLRIVYDPRRKPGRRLVSVKVRCAKCDAPSYSILRRPDSYLVVTTEDVAIGIYGHKFVKDQKATFKPEKVTVRDAICQYIEETKIIYICNSDRIIQQAKLSSTVILKTNQYILSILAIYSGIIMCINFNSITCN